MLRVPSLLPKVWISHLFGLALLVSLACGGGSGGTPAAGGGGSSAPAIAGISQNTAAPGTVLTLTGTGFAGPSQAPAVPQVWFGTFQGTNVFASTDGTQITVTVPPGSGTVTVAVTTTAGTSASGPTFTFQVPIPTIVSANLDSAAPNDLLILSGSGFAGVTQVMFGTFPAAKFNWSSDGTELAITVPVGTGSVTVTVTNATGTTPSGPTFTFKMVPITAAGFTPASGPPGTLVTFTGGPFSASDQVLFGTAAVTSKVSANAGTISAWVPDLATGQAPGPVAVSVQTLTSGTIPSGTFTVQAPRFAILAQPFVEVPAQGLVPAYTGREFDFPVVRRTAQYGLSLPQAPVLHPYDPDTEPGSGVRPGFLAPSGTINILFPPAFLAVLPAPVLQQITASGISTDNVDILCNSQNLIWDATNPYEFRPHYWTDPDAPLIGTYSEVSNISVGIYQAESAVTLPGPSLFFPAQISVHPIGANALGIPPGLILSSPPNLNMTGINYQNSTSFWSLTVDGVKAAATLHLIFNDSDQATVSGIMDQPAPITIGQLAIGLAGGMLTNPQLAAQAGALFQPVITGALLGAVPQNGNPTLTILGSGFTGGTVTVGTANQAGGNLQVVSDSVITVTIPQATAAQGNIIVTTPLGASAPAALN